LRAISRETQGGSVGGGPVFRPPEPLAAPRRGASFPTSVGGGGIAGQDYIPPQATYRPPGYTGP
jgi:hypothetical protein